MPARSELLKAIFHAKRSWAVLLIAKMDRLARNVFFTSTLLESGVQFLAVDAQYASRLSIHIMAAVAEEETRLISERTRNALAAAQSRGILLGPKTFRNLEAWKPKQKEARKLATVCNSQIAYAGYAEIRPLVLELRAQGWSFGKIACELDRLGSSHAAWRDVKAPQVRRVVNQAGVLSSEIS